MENKIIVEEDISLRIDKYLSNKFPEFSRTFISNSIIKVNNKIVKPSYKIVKDDEIVLETEEILDFDLTKCDKKLDIVYEDDDIIVINKEYNMVVHPGSGNKDQTLVNCLYNYLGEDYKSLDLTRPGIVHRLDKETSGLMVVAKTEYSQQKLIKQFSKRSVCKYYYAIVKNIMSEKEGVIDKNITRDKKSRTKFTTSEKEGKTAITEFNVIQNFSDSSLVNVHIITGRTHQIRVHFLSINHPVVGDSIYSRKTSTSLMLQSYHLEFNHPVSKKRMVFNIDLDPRLKEYILERDPNFSL